MFTQLWSGGLVNPNLVDIELWAQDVRLKHEEAFKPMQDKLIKLGDKIRSTITGSSGVTSTFDSSRLNNLPTLSYEERISRNANTLYMGYKLSPEVNEESVLPEIRKVSLSTQEMNTAYNSLSVISIQMFGSLAGYTVMYPVYAWTEPYEVGHPLPYPAPALFWRASGAYKTERKREKERATCSRC